MRACSREVLCRVATTLHQSPTSCKTVALEIGLSSAQQAVGLCHPNVSEPRQISREAEEVRPCLSTNHQEIGLFGRSGQQKQQKVRPILACAA